MAEPLYLLFLPAKKFAEAPWPADIVGIRIKWQDRILMLDGAAS